MRKNKWQLAVAAAGAVLVAAGCGIAGDAGSGNDSAGESQQAAAGEATSQPADEPGQSGGPEAGGPDTSDIPDPVAEVNGEKISREEFLSVFENQYKVMSKQAQSTGQPVDEQQLKDLTSQGLIGTVLLTQEAEKRGIDVTEDEVQAELGTFAEQNGVSIDEFITGMGKQGLDREAVLEQIDKQLRVEKLLAEEYGEFNATDAEVQEAYNKVAEQQSMMGGRAGGAAGGAPQLPPLEQVRGQVEEQVATEKEATAMEEFSQKLREGADVVVHL